MSSRRRNSTCFYPSCKTGYLSNKEKLSLFVAPRDKVLFEKWKNIIPRADRVLQETDVVCEKHFYTDDVIREWRSGDVVFPYKRKMLRPGAIPAPYLEDRRLMVRKKPRKPPMVRKELPKKVKKIKEKPVENPFEEVPEVFLKAEPLEMVQEIFIDVFDEIIYKKHSLKLPESWGFHVQQDKIIITECQLCADTNKPYLTRQIVINKDTTYELYYCDNCIDKMLIDDLNNMELQRYNDVDQLIEIYANTQFCIGGPKTRAYPASEMSTRVARVDSSGRWRHQMCPVVSRTPGSCIYCNSLHTTFYTYQARKLMKKKHARAENQTINRYKHKNIELNQIIKDLKGKLDEIGSISQ